jgi:SPP1 gp7 family putative phage head morphogenesis protein
MADAVSEALKGAIADLATVDGSQGRVRLEVIGNYRASLTSAEAQLYDEFIALAQDESQFSVELFEESINAAIDAVDSADMIAAIDGTRMDIIEGQRITIPQMLSQFTEVKAVQMNRILQDGFTEGLTQDQLISRVREIEPLQRRQAAALVRTGTNSVSSIARYRTAVENRDVLEGYEWVSTLDDRTSLVCASRDGMVYEFAESSPKPPAHWNACVEGSLITTKRGKIPIESVKVGDMVMTHAGRWKPVTCVMAKPHKGRVKTLIDRFGHRVTMTDDHPILTDVGYRDFDSIEAGANIFKYTAKLSRLKHWLLGSLIEDRVLTDSHDLKTETTERLVAYTVTSFAAGMSSSVNLKNNGVNDKVGNIRPSWLLEFKRHAMIAKKFFYKCFVKGGVILKVLR